ncbi:MAG: hypothetical protein ACYSUX_11920, partial [Planctomycetota bacterium]
MVIVDCIFKFPLGFDDLVCLFGGLGSRLRFVRLRHLGRLRGYKRDELVEHFRQGAWLHIRFGRPAIDEIAARAEFTQGLGRVVFIAKQFSSFVGIRESVVCIHKQMSVSAKGAELPKQKPNKKGWPASFFSRSHCEGHRVNYMGR